MRITLHVDLPEAVVSAAVDGSLVLFVGAGASFGAPSELPSYNELADDVARLHGEQFKPGSVPADEYLGGLIDRFDSVRQEVKAIIGQPASFPNATHRAIVRVAHSSSAVRIVTTNYDEHLTTAAVELGLDLGDRFNSPAVPLGRSFSGLVHLHGALSRSTNDWVLSDADFGRAYLTDGWARQFVQAAFQTYTVLFIGYSHEDPVMSYLARGLPPASNRFALTSDADKPKWASLRITPIAYPSNDGHAALPEALEAWANQLSMGALDHRERVKDIVSGGPPKAPVDNDYLAAALSTPVGVRAFAESAAGLAWLQWAERHQDFRAIFLPGRIISDSSQILARWFAERFAVDSEGLHHALPLLARLGPVVSEDLMNELWSIARESRVSDPAHWTKLTTITSAALRTDTADPADLGVFLYGQKIEDAVALPLLRRALRPRLVLQENSRWWLVEDEELPTFVSATIGWSCDEYQLDSLLDAVRSAFPATASSVLQITEQALREGFGLLSNFEGSASIYNWPSRRNAIEPHSQNIMREIEDSMIDILRDASERVEQLDSGLVARWLADDLKIFQRLALHLARTGGLLPHDQFELLMSRHLLFDLDIQHEVYLLISELAPRLDAADRARLLDAIQQGPPAFDFVMESRLHRRSIFDLLEWISRTTSDWRELDDALERILDLEPDMGVRDHPDMTMWVTSGTWGGELPMEVEEFTQLIRTSGAAEALREVFSGENLSERHFGEPTWDDALSLLRQTTAGDVLLGEELLAGAEVVTPFQTGPLVSAIIYGWSTSATSDSQLNTVLDLLLSHVTDASLRRPLSELLQSAVGRGIEARSIALLSRLSELADHLWDSFDSQEGQTDTDDWTSEALNTPSGHIATFWVNRIRIRWRAAGTEWGGLDERERQAISKMLQERTGKGRGPLAAVAGDLYFFHAADPAYTADHIFPLFNATDPRAKHAWIAYLYHARVGDEMLDDGFWPLLVEAGAIMATAGRFDVHHRSLLANVAVHATSSKVNRTDLIGFLAAANRLDGFTDALAMVLSEASSEAVEASWSKWLRDCLVGRASLPATSWQEKAAWGDLALRLGPFAAEAIQITSSSPGPLGNGTRFDELSDSVLAADARLVSSAVLERLRLTSTPDWHIRHQLEELIQRLANAGLASEALRPIVEAALQKGIYDAANWPTDPS